MRSKEEATRIVYVRHGKTDFPLDRIYCDDKEDPVLNGLGLAQAERAAKVIAEMDVSAVYASPRARTRMTAEIIATTHGLAIDFDARLMERRFGFWEGMYFDEIEQQYPVEYEDWKVNNAAFKPEGGESVYDLQGRLTPCLEAIVARHKAQTVVVVSHVGPIRVALAEAVGVPIEKYRSLTIDYAGISIVDYGRRQNNLICLNK